MYFDPGTGDFVVVDGQIVERDALHIAEKIKEYDENLEILCLDPDRMDNINEAPFVICCRRPDGTLYRIFEAWKLDDTVVERVACADNHRFSLNDRYESLKAMEEKLKQDRYKDKMLENADIVAAAVRNRTSSFKFRNDEGDLVTIHEDKPSEKGNGRTYSYT